MKKLLIVLLFIMSVSNGLYAQTYAPFCMKCQFSNSAGVPLASGKLYTYLAGGSTPTATYTTSTGTANANPIILDSAGRAVIYLAAVSYKMELYTAADVLVWTQDNIYEPSFIIDHDFGGTEDLIAKFDAAGAPEDSSITDNGTTVTVGVTTNAAGTLYVAKNTAVTAGLDQATGDAVGPTLNCDKSRGTQSSRSDVNNADVICSVIFRAYTGSMFTTAQIDAIVDGAVTTGQRPPSALMFYTNVANTAHVLRAKLGTSGGLMMFDASGVAPTGGDKGPGSINLAEDIYKDNTAFTNPDYVFEHYFKGGISKFKNNAGASSYTGLKSLAYTRDYAKRHLQLPGVGSTTGMFARADALLLHVEELYLHLFEMQDTISKLTARIKTLESRK